MSHTRPRAVVGQLILYANVLLACAPNDVVVAEIRPDAGYDLNTGDGGFAAGGAPCTSSNDCSIEDFCERNGCGATSGYCHHVPAFCDPSRGAVCGCDGVTYWNDCLRKQSGVASAVDGECEDGASCASATDCPGTGASCARLLAPGRACPSALGEAPGTIPPGICWHLPPVCPTDDSGDPALLLACVNGGIGTTCQTICETIRSEAPAVEASSCYGDH